MLKPLLIVLLIFPISILAQNSFESDLDSISTTSDATKFIENYKSIKGKLITFNKEKHNTQLADDIFKLGKGGKKVYKTDISKTYYKVIEKYKVPHHRVSYIYFDGKQKSLVEINALRKSIISKYNECYRFKDLAKYYSMDRNATRGGDLGWFAEGKMHKDFETPIISGNYNIDDIFTIDVTEQQKYYVVLKTHNTKMIDEVKVLKLIEITK